MSQGITQCITRRGIWRGIAIATLVALLVVAGIGAVASLSGCTATSTPTADITVTSSTDNNHSHKVTIPGADIDAAPAEKTYTSDGSHQHQITLKRADFVAIKNGQSVTLTSTAAGGTPHTHTFIIKKA